MNKRILVILFYMMLFYGNPLFASEKIRIVWVDKDGNYILNKEYISSAQKPIKAILAYYSLKGGISCWWEGDKPNKEWDNINCGLTQVLELSYQCSQTQLDFVNQWFADEKRQFTKNNCNNALETATHSNRFPFLEIEIKGDIVSVNYKESGHYLRDGEFWSYWGRDTFKIYPEKVAILQRMKFKLNQWVSELD